MNPEYSKKLLDQIARMIEEMNMPPPNCIRIFLDYEDASSEIILCNSNKGKIYSSKLH